ncbi:MAG: adenine deaminase [Intestinibacillus sp.]
MNYQTYPAMARAALGEEPAETVFKNGRILNVFTGEILAGDIAVCEGMIVGVGEGYHGKQELDLAGQFVAPGFMDAHLHLESTMVTPPFLMESSVPRGTTTYIADPHEAANVMGWEGIRYFIDGTRDVPANVYFMLPSCVPATPFEMSGCVFDAAEMGRYKSSERVLGLGEVMDYVSVVNGEPGMMAKLAQFEERPRDGHAPGLTGGVLSAYALAGIHTDHECMTFEEALEKRRMGMHIHVREGSAGKNLEALVKGLVESGMDTAGFSFCTDDAHIEDIRRQGHIDHCIRRAIALGLSPVKAYAMASINTARCYGRHNLGAIAPGYQADLVVVRDLERVEITAVYHKGTDIADWHATAPVLAENSPLRHTVHVAPMGTDVFRLKASEGEQDVIGLISGQLATRHLHLKLPAQNGLFVPEQGFNKLAVVERHHATGAVGVAPILGYGLQGGAIATTVSHDSHNLLVAGDNDDDMLLAVQELVRAGGGYTIVSRGKVQATLSLSVLGLISDQPYEEVERTLQDMIRIARAMGVPEGVEPFITLSFLALPVIPAIRLTPKGLFDVENFTFLV